MSQTLVTPKQAAFARGIADGLGVKEAAIRAGYSEKYAARKSGNLMNSPRVLAEIERLRAPTRARASVSRERIIEEYARIAFFDIKRLFDDFGNFRDVKDWSPEESAAIAGIDVEMRADGTPVAKIRPSSKIAALNALSRIYGLEDGAPDEGERVVFQMVLNGRVQLTHES